MATDSGGRRELSVPCDLVASAPVGSVDLRLVRTRATLSALLLLVAVGVGYASAASAAPGSRLGDGSARAARTPPFSGAVAVACPTIDQCTLVDTVGIATFNPTRPSAPIQPGADPYGEPQGLACPSATECVAAGPTTGGDNTAIILDPRNPKVRRRAPILPAETHFAGEPFNVPLSCVRTTECVASRRHGRP